MQVLRRHRGTVSGEVLAREAGVSLRTIRRDIATLQAMGADIDGAPGVGYILRPGFLLPPLSFTEEELQALVAGAQWVSRQTDDALALAAQNALAKIGGVLPPEMRRALDDDALYIGRQKEGTLARVRQAIREQRKMLIEYTDQAGAASERIIWPIMLGLRRRPTVHRGMVRTARGLPSVPRGPDCEGHLPGRPLFAQSPTACQRVACSGRPPPWSAQIVC